MNLSKEFKKWLDDNTVDGKIEVDLLLNKLNKTIVSEFPNINKDLEFVDPNIIDIPWSDIDCLSYFVVKAINSNLYDVGKIITDEKGNIYEIEDSAPYFSNKEKNKVLLVKKQLS
jgi:hypothetical protein